MFLEAVLIIIGFVFLIKGADFLVTSATGIAKKFGLSEMLIGLTIVAIGTSLPEIFVTIVSSVEGHSDLIIGNAVGSSICNFLFVIGVTSLIRPVKFEERIINRHLPIGLLSMLLLLILGNTDRFNEVQTITRWQGWVLILFTFTYILYTIYEEKNIKNKQIEIEILEEVEEYEKKSTSRIILYLLLGLIGLKFGADLVVDNSVLIASQLGLSEKFIGMTIIAIGTALPEVITGVIAARKNETDLLLGNISGSNILNLCLLIGLGAIINPLKFATDFNSSIILLIVVTIFIEFIAMFSKKRELNRKQGIVLIVFYVLYIVSMLI